MVLLRQKFRRYIAFGDVLGYVTWIHESAELFKASDEIPEYTDDPDDDYLVDLVLSSRADVLISGDQHLLDLNTIRDGEDRAIARVLTPREFLDELQ